MKSTGTKLIRNSTAEFLIFTGQAGEQSIEARYEDETVWLTQKADGRTVCRGCTHGQRTLKNIFESGELARGTTLGNSGQFKPRAAAGQPQRRLLQPRCHHLGRLGQFRACNPVPPVGDQRAARIRHQGFRFGQKKRLENGAFLNEDYFERLLSEIREIRLSERKFYQKITDIYATAVDYNRDAPTTKAFLPKYRISCTLPFMAHTAAELIVHRADATQPHMGLTSWEKAPDGKILKTDGGRQNYLSREELESLGRIVNAYLDLAEERRSAKFP